jgi:hypothetical protein
MDWQQIAALGVVGATAAVFLWAKLRPRKFSFQRETHCGCALAGQPAAKSSIVFHARKGERSQVVLKMK